MAKRHVSLAILFASIGAVASAKAEEFPARSITWVVPFAPGGITDTTSRIVAEEMSKTLGQSVLIDNRAGRRRWARSTVADAALAGRGGGRIKRTKNLVTASDCATREHRAAVNTGG
jgi:hypothetical protein